MKQDGVLILIKALESIANPVPALIKAVEGKGLTDTDAAILVVQALDEKLLSGWAKDALEKYEASGRGCSMCYDAVPAGCATT